MANTKKPSKNNGLTAKQKKLPPALQKVILKSKNKKKKVKIVSGNKNSKAKKAQVIMAYQAVFVVFFFGFFPLPKI